MMIPDFLWRAELRIARFLGRLRCQLTRRHVYLPMYPEGYCSRCGDYQKPLHWHIEPNYPKWYRDHYGELNAENDKTWNAIHNRIGINNRGNRK